jgi:hypothetical protein
MAESKNSVISVLTQLRSQGRIDTVSEASYCSRYFAEAVVAAILSVLDLEEHWRRYSTVSYHFYTDSNNR